MWKTTIRGLLARRVRLALTAMAVLLGVSFVSATYVLTDTVRRSFDAVFAQSLTGVDLTVQGLRPLGTGDPPRIPESALDQVRAVPGVARAEGYVTGYAQFVARDGESIGGGGPPTIGASWTDGGPYRLADDGVSRPPRRADEVAMDAATAHEHGFSVGDHVRVLLAARPRSSRSSASSASVTATTSVRSRSRHSTSAPRRRSSRRRAHSIGSTSRRIRARPRTSCGRGSSSRSAAASRCSPSSQAIDQIGETVRTFLGFFTYALLGFAAIGVVVGAFVIFNTFTILVTQRTRELGLLRAMGASGSQVVWSVVLEALVVGAIASSSGS